MDKEIVQVDLKNEVHCKALVGLLNDYMLDEMGQGAPMKVGLAAKIVEGLCAQRNYVGFFVVADGDFAALANCFVNYSTWQAKQLLNIHDFIVSPSYRRLGIGELLLEGIQQYASENAMCKVTLEVREDNVKAKNLYSKVGYKPHTPNYYFWERAVACV